jgi:hypothetical protein
MEDGGSITRETSVNSYQTAQRSIPEDRHLYARRRDNLKSRVNGNTHSIKLTDIRRILGSGSVRHFVCCPIIIGPFVQGVIERILISICRASFIWTMLWHKSGSMPTAKIIRKRVNARFWLVFLLFFRLFHTVQRPFAGASVFCDWWVLLIYFKLLISVRSVWDIAFWILWIRHKCVYFFILIHRVGYN